MWMVLPEDSKTGGQESNLVLSESNGEAQNRLISVFICQKMEKYPCRIAVKLSFAI